MDKTEKEMKYLFGLLSLLVLISPVLAVDVTTLDSGTSTDWMVWILSGLIGLVLFLMSLNVPYSQAEVEVDTIISVMAWIPIGFCAYASFSVSRVVGTGYLTIYSMSVIGILMFVFLVVAIINTIRLIILHRVFSGSDQE